ncbi:putative hydro-lyase [Actinospica sp. MGRD01-02]|uniref:Putative hydro-lyase KDK95_26260 n=1 Tax=Actinospica acidithermotolerans TaxID=2828514 RepID=A0A941EEA9_9ACTN|nr:putative hydro-lyase [Actinospica acidithermotolerans]MBR7829836.1 putative hydro-lyase [Actinospica acidithermotolerans]
MTLPPVRLGNISPAAAREVFRAGTAQPTSGLALGHTQANLIALPREYAYDMLLFAQRNPKPCPVLEVTEPGSWTSVLAPGADLRTDLPAYRVWRDGRLADSPREVRDVWRDDLVTFLIGCSFSFETLLLAAGVPLRHVEQSVNVPMYVTDRDCVPAGRLRGPLVVSMRPVPAEAVARAAAITALMPAVHGAPVHVGEPEALGIADLDKPDFGEPVTFHSGDVPMFWACGVTSQTAVMSAAPPFAITHEPGCMFITDARDTDYRVA